MNILHFLLSGTQITNDMIQLWCEEEQGQNRSQKSLDSRNFTWQEKYVNLVDELRMCKYVQFQ